MNWFNYYGLIVVAVMLAPNIVYAVKRKGEAGMYKNKAAEVIEQASRYACMLFMVFNIPYTYVGFYFKFALAVYLIVNGVLLLSYCLVWMILWKRDGMVKAVLLSVLPSIIFLFSGVMVGSIPLVSFAVTFSVTHVLISVKNAPSKNVRQGVVTAVGICLSLVLLAVVTLGGIVGYGQSNVKKLDKMTAKDMIEYDAQAKGAAISVVYIEDGAVTYRYYGQEGAHDYEIGSISKTLVGLMCDKAVKEGRIDLRDSVAKYLDFDQSKYYPTIERLLTHTSGYEGYYFDSQMIANKLSMESNDYYGISREKVLNKARSLSLEDKDYPFLYSNFGIAVVGLVLEKVYGADFTDLMNDFIKSELHLNNTIVAKQTGDFGNYWKWKANDGYLPAGGIISNIEDMAKYLSIVMGDGYTDTYVKIKDIDERNVTYEKMNIRTDAVGMTWMKDEENGIVWHNGGTGYYNSYIGFTKDKKRGVVILSNLSPDERISVTVIGARLLTSTETL